MENDVFEDLVKKFITDYYPVKRVKINARFKRAIIIENKPYFLNGVEKNKIKHELIDVLKLVFSCDNVFALKMIGKTLNL
jgi:hypothetical protein